MEASGLKTRKAFLNLVELFAHWHHPEPAETLDESKLLHVQSPKACVIKSFRHHTKGVAHEDLVYPVAGQEVCGGLLHIVLGVGAQYP